MIPFVICVLLKTKYAAVALVLQLMEIQSIFKQIQRLLQIFQVDESSLTFRINSICSLITCAIFRVLLSFWFVTFLVTNRKRGATIDFLLSFFGSLFFLHQNIKIFGKAWKTVMWQQRYKKTVVVG